MKRISWLSALAPALLVLVMACSHAPKPAAPAPLGNAPDVAEATSPGDVAQVGAGETEDDSTADLAEHHRHHHHGGLAMFIAMSMDELNTTPDQQATIKKLKGDLHAQMQPAHDAEREVLGALADGIATGNIDQAKIDSGIAQLATASARVHETVAESINELHAILTPPQRAALVDKVEAHLAVWDHANSVDEPATKDGHGGHLGKLAAEYGLTPQQVETVRASFRAAVAASPVKYDRTEATASMTAFAEAFRSPTFDARKVPNASTVTNHMAAWGMTRTALLYEALMPVLTQDQRMKVADELRHHANYKHSEMETGTGV